MDPVELLAALAIGLAAGLAGGMIGVGGGVLFVPGLVLFLGLGQLDAQATSLLAVVLVGAVGAWRQGRYGNLRLRDGAIIGVLSPIGVLAGTVAANLASERLLQLSFAVVQLVFALQLGRRALRAPSGAD
ncbi:MAG TPA: sulfite exporter TauE/SafE family protein [Thermoleophilaceae bacterium]|nr:sulfite exporter TauE/SafE family protein [Thermoleophilaceae bacterium]